MSRRLIPLSAKTASAASSACAGCVYWESSDPLEVRCGSACDPDRQREWFACVHEEWGECGRAVTEDDEVIGFIKYAPASYFPQASWYLVKVPDPAAPLIACMHIREEARRRGLGRVLLQAALRDLHARRERTVYSYALASKADMNTVPMVGMDFLLRNGFNIEKPHPAYPLLRLDLRSLAAWTENLEAVLESLLLPLGKARRLTIPSIDIRGTDR